MDETIALLIKSQAEQIRLLTDTNARLTDELVQVRQKVDQLLTQLAWFTRQYFGRKSEKLSLLDPNQLSLFESLTTEQLRLEAIEAAREKAETQIIESTQKTVAPKTERANRQLLDKLPVIQVVVEPESVDLEHYKQIGSESTRTIEFEPGKLYVKETVYPKYGLKDNTYVPADGQRGVIMAQRVLTPIYKGLPGASLLAEILLQKYEYHVPFYRQVRQFKHLGLDIPETTLNGWFKPACELLKPLYEVLKTEVLETDYIQVDETTLPVIDKEKRKAAKEYLWTVRSVMKRMIFFHYENGSRSTRTVTQLLGTYHGHLQSDGYKAYDAFNDNDDVTQIACMAHIRRHFETGLKENKTLAEFALSQIQLLYRLEKKADEENVSYQERAAMRDQYARPIIESLEAWMEKTYPTVLPKSLMGKAIGYAYGLWGRMKNYLNDGRIKIDNNLIENAIRPIALGRKNFLFAGNHQAAENTAIICSLLSTCKEAGVNPREWLMDVLNKMPYLQQSGSDTELKELLPNNWNLAKV
jgi:transposase/IS1 family transposase